MERISCIFSPWFPSEKSRLDRSPPPPPPLPAGLQTEIVPSWSHGPGDLNLWTQSRALRLCEDGKAIGSNKSTAAGSGNWLPFSFLSSRNSMCLRPAFQSLPPLKKTMPVSIKVNCFKAQCSSQMRKRNRLIGAGGNSIQADHHGAPHLTLRLFR